MGFEYGDRLPLHGSESLLRWYRNLPLRFSSTHFRNPAFANNWAVAITRGIWESLRHLLCPLSRHSPHHKNINGRGEAHGMVIQRSNGFCAAGKIIIWTGKNWRTLSSYKTGDTWRTRSRSFSTVGLYCVDLRLSDCPSNNYLFAVGCY
jgi:hypothetical protein